MTRILAMAAMALLVGCSDSGSTDREGLACKTHADCGDGWVCGSDDFTEVCTKAWENKNGITADKLVIGNSSGHKDPSKAKEVSLAIVNGVQAYIKHLNENLKGIHGRQIELDLQSNEYDGEIAKQQTEDMTNPDANGSRKVFAIIGNGGTPTTAQAFPVATTNKTIFFGPVTGAAFLRTSPPNRYGFNYRVSYGQQAEAGAKWMAETRKLGTIDPSNIAVFAQGLSDGGQDGCTWDEAGAITCQDAEEYQKRVDQVDPFGIEGYDGVVKYLTERHGLENNEVIFATHDRTVVNVDAAVGRYLHWLGRPKRVAVAGQDFDAGIVLQVVTNPAAAMVQSLRDVIANVKADNTPDAKYGNFTDEELAEIKHVQSVSFVGTLIGGAFAAALQELGNDGRYCQGVLAMQVVPHPSEATTKLALEYRDALKAFDSSLQPDVFSLEGYVAMKLFVAGLDNLGKDLTTEALVDTFESMSNIDIGLGTNLGFSNTNHQASQTNWAQELTDTCGLTDFPL